MIKKPPYSSNAWAIDKCLIHKSVITEKVLEILELINEERSSFNVIQNFFSKFHHAHAENGEINISEKEITILNKNCIDSLNEIIKNSGLIGI